ncbi:MAG: tRNA lysidine(34) synthetase TilS [Chitinophagaceae bacterium]|nr:tRNA lysidine(34) synthetase TilS [Chitinophagaceae bacterium]
MDLQQRFAEYIRANHLFTVNDKLLLAVSGGADSVVLAWLCKSAGFDFIILHCNFQLRGAESDRDEQFVRRLADQLGVTVLVKTFNTIQYKEKEGISTQEAARSLRYEWFDEILDQHNTANKPAWLLTAHHADDNIETVAMNFFRGTGIRGLKGMQPRNGKIIRPLLFARRSDIEEYTLLHGLEYVTDSSNLDDNYTRNFFRLRVLPMLKSVYPATEENLLHNIDRLAEAAELYEQSVDLYRHDLAEKKGGEYHIPVLKLLKSRPLRTIVYELISPFHFTAKQTEEVIALLDSETGKYVASSTHRIFRNRKWLIISPLATGEASNLLINDTDSAISYTAGTMKLEYSADLATTPDVMTAVLDVKEVTFPLLLRRWKAGDYFYPLGMKKKKKVSRFLIDKKLSLSEKENVWVLESAKRIVWVVGHRIDDRFKVTGNTKAVWRIVNSCIP